ncbi:hypothetical protein [Pseudalkalibacillus caeni]|uniref:Uncharacterized protein n=1 Tax=Exobacillus caeni TaxID=2574798 RepID=A0A5R9EZU4_9BACL|nr:hypothetical protein [Pseudalkalibacillus caeni]TLS36757.1 hypothetical protein FCL54_12390 [Pseudalkalibacillus caeni]
MTAYDIRLSHNNKQSKVHSEDYETVITILQRLEENEQVTTAIKESETTNNELISFQASESPLDTICSIEKEKQLVHYIDIYLFKTLCEANQIQINYLK